MHFVAVLTTHGSGGKKELCVLDKPKCALLLALEVLCLESSQEPKTMENLNQVDDMVCEYLLFRGFTNVLEGVWR